MQLKKAVNYLTEKFRKGVEYGPNIAAWRGGSGILFLILAGVFPVTGRLLFLLVILSHTSAS